MRRGPSARYSLNESLPLQASLPVPCAHFARPPELESNIYWVYEKNVFLTPSLVFSTTQLRLPLKGTLKRKGEEACRQPLFFKTLVQHLLHAMLCAQPWAQELDGVRQKPFLIPG